MSECKRAKSLGAEIRRRKLEVLEKGEITDFSFLVGADDGPQEEMHCFKSDLMLASDYFAALLRNTPDKNVPVRMKHVQPHIFSRILRFISLQELKEVENAEDAVSLALAADEFLMELLVPFCASQLQKTVTVDNIWQILNDHPKIPAIRLACVKFLQSETKACLDHPSFLTVSKKSLIFLLKLDFLNVESEKAVFEACLKLANTRQSAKAKANLMKAAMPHLRLLNLEAKDVTPEVLKYLTEPQKVFLLSKLSSVKMSDAAPENFNLNCSPRRPPAKVRVLQIIPDEMVPPAERMTTGPFVPCKTFGANFYPKVDISISSFEILTPANNNAILCGLLRSRAGANRMRCNTEKISFAVRLSVFYENKVWKLIHSENYLFPNANYSSSVHLKMEKALSFSKGARINLIFTLGHPCSMSLSPEREFKFIELTQEQAQIVSANLQKEKDLVTPSFFRKAEAGAEAMEVSGTNCCFIKSVHYEIV